MYMVPQSAPAARAAATPRAAWPAGACAADATVRRVAPAHITAAPPSTAATRDQPAPRSPLKNTAPHRIPSRLFAFHSANATLRPMSLIAYMVSVLATAHRQPARMARSEGGGAAGPPPRPAL